MSRRTQMIDAWIDWAFEQRRLIYKNPPGHISDGRGMVYGVSAAEFSNFEGLAVAVERRREDGVPLARMSLPNLLTNRRWGEVYKALKRKGIPVIVAPAAVLRQSDIVVATAVIVAEELRRRPFRPPQQLIRATVYPRYSQYKRESYFLSGYDLNERGLSYFFCELPPGYEPTTVEEAYRALQPESVKRALAQGRKVLRQGDMFFIQTQDEEGPLEESVLKNACLFDTNHYASEWAHHGGLVMVRGKVYHKPLNRRPDHRPLYLPGRRWWIAVRNTVPVVDNYKKSHGW